MAEYWKPQKYDRGAIDKAISKLSKLARTRNDWVHGVWSENRVTGDIVIFDFRAPEENGRRKPVTASAVLNHISAVKDRTKALRDLLPGIPP